jgi:hypothetical protein
MELKIAYNMCGDELSRSSDSAWKPLYTTRRRNAIRYLSAEQEVKSGAERNGERLALGCAAKLL